MRRRIRRAAEVCAPCERPVMGPERHETMPKVEMHPPPTTRWSGAMMMLLWLHNGVLRYQQRTSPLPLGKTLFLATVTVHICCAWALCSLRGHRNILLYWRFHDSRSYLLVMASMLLLEFVTLENQFAVIYRLPILLRSLMFSGRGPGASRAHPVRLRQGRTGR